VEWEDGEEIDRVSLTEFAFISSEAAASLQIEPPMGLFASAALSPHFTEKLSLL
jgi:hypothetical protein